MQPIACAKTRRSRRIGDWLVLPLVLAAGCAEQSGPATVAATGSVTYQGQPVEGANVTLLPADPSGSLRGAQGVTDAEGRFELTTYTGEVGKFKPGAMPGEYHVTVNKLDLTGPNTTGRPPENLLPAKYNSAKASGLAATISADGENSIQLSLE